jgi:3-oxoacyl-[acyl-carrier protein] reductase
MAAETNRAVIITGGGKGIGRAVGVRLASEGWSVALCYRHSAVDAEDAGEEIRRAGGRALVVRCDVSQADACERFVEQTAAEFGRLDALVNCAGPFRRQPLLEESLEGWHEMFDNNLHPVFYMSRVVAPRLVARKWGRIVNFSMATADRITAQPACTAHFIAKSGVLILTRTLARVLAPHNITVNAVAPGFIDSGSLPDEELQRTVKNIPAGYVGHLQDAASAVGYLLSDEARYVNGANLHVSGGWGI